MAISERVNSTASSILKNAKKRRKLVHPLSEDRYAAKLLFQFRFDNDTPVSMRMVEERIIVILAKSASDAYKKALSRGKKNQARFKNEEGLLVNFEFVGVSDLMHLGVECESDEVWYEIRRMKSPVERKNKIIPEKRSLSAFQYESRKKRRLKA